MSVMNIVVRAVRNGDYQNLHQVYTCPGVMKNTLGLPYAPLDFWKKRTENRSPRDHVLVAEVDGRVVGSINLHCGVGRMAHSSGYGMGIHDDFQGQGRSFLMDAMIDLAENWLNTQRTKLQVYADNEPGISLYEKFGFEIEGTHRNHAFQVGLYVDSYTMARLRS